MITHEHAAKRLLKHWLSIICSHNPKQHVLSEVYVQGQETVAEEMDRLIKNWLAASKAGGTRLASVNNCKEVTPMNHQELMKLSSVNTGELGRKKHKAWLQMMANNEHWDWLRALTDANTKKQHSTGDPSISTASQMEKGCYL